MINCEIVDYEDELDYVVETWDHFSDIPENILQTLIELIKLVDPEHATYSDSELKGLIKDDFDAGLL